jgi:hypothetical protein
LRAKKGIRLTVLHAVLKQHLDGGQTWRVMKGRSGPTQ